ncbi:MAG: hypothetical protein WA510_02695 [Acidobacteriaceae bacterium]
MRVLMAQFKIKPECLEHFEAARERILAALSEERPNGVHYTWCRLSDGQSFTGWLELDPGVENPLPKMAAGQEFMSHIATWVAGPPIREELEVVGSYRSIREAALPPSRTAEITS